MADARRLQPAIVPLHCSYETFQKAWERTHCVLLRRPTSDRRTRAQAALPAWTDPLLARLRINALLLEETYTAEGQGASTATSQKRKKGGSDDNGAPPTAAALFRGASLPLGRYYSSFVVACKPMLISSILENVRGLAPPCFAGGGVCEETALWFFIGCNEGTEQYLSGRPAHTDAVKHDGTFHRQISGRKEWTLRPTEELARRLGRVDDANGDGDDEESELATVITCEAGDVLVVSTREWWHCTRLPPGKGGEGGEGSSLSVSIAREFNLMTRGAAPSLEEHAGIGDGDDTETSFVNVDGLFATRSIAAGSVVLTEEEAAAGLELPTEADPNCEVAEDEETGALVLIARRDIRSGEFLSVGADEEDD